MMNRRDLLKASAITAATGFLTALAPGAEVATRPAAARFMLPPLPYAYDALEPFIDARTMEIHHSKHHAAYVDNLNKALGQLPANAAFPQGSIEAVIAQMDAVPESVRTTVRNNGGGHANHSFFWSLLKKNEGAVPGGRLAEALTGQFGDFAKFSEAFTKQATGVFGSGWAWLSVSKEKKLVLEATANQDSPLMHGNTPLLGLDVWEHAYYLKYQNRRAEYIKAFFNVIDWTRVEAHFAAATA